MEGRGSRLSHFGQRSQILENTFKRLRLLIVTFITAALSVALYSALPSSPAKAQEGRFAIEPMTLKSAGPIQLNHSESARIGLLLPAVRQVERQGHLQLFDNGGARIADIPITMDGSVRTVFFDVLFMDGSVRVMDHATGKVLAEAPGSDGGFSAVFLPAVQRGGNQIGPVTGSVQLFNADHMRGQVIVMCDGSV